MDYQKCTIDELAIFVQQSPSNRITQQRRYYKTKGRLDIVDKIDTAREIASINRMEDSIKKKQRVIGYTRNNDFHQLIGSRYGENGNLEIISVEEERDGNRSCLVKCHTCCLDSELFGEAIFKTKIVNLKSGCIPCGCAKTVRWSKAQYEVKINRQAEIKNYKFIGFSDYNVKNDQNNHGVWTMLADMGFDN